MARGQREPSQQAPAKRAKLCGLGKGRLGEPLQKLKRLFFSRFYSAPKTGVRFWLGTLLSRFIMRPHAPVTE
jgi:hypothetical protein